MLRLTNKYKLYLYLTFLIFLSTTFNFQLFEIYKNKFSLKNININGLSDEEKINIENELNKLKNKNIFKISENNVLEKLSKFSFLENISVKKIMPSSLNINLSKTFIVGKSFINGEEFYIGKNGKLINSKLIFIKNKIPEVFGEFEIMEFLNLYNIVNSQQYEIGEIEKYYYYKNRRWDLLLSNGLTLMLPSKNQKNSIKIYKQLLDNGNLNNIKIVDLRVVNQIIMTGKNE